MDSHYIFEKDSGRFSLVTEAELMAIGHCFSQECQDLSGRQLVEKLQAWIEQLERGQTINLVEWTVELDGEDVELRHNSTFEQATESEGNEDWPVFCQCGLLDLVAILMNWRDFISETLVERRIP